MRLPPGIRGPLHLDTFMRIHRIIHQLLKRLKDTHERFLILKQTIAESSKSIFIIVYELTQQMREHNEEEDTFLPLAFRDLTGDELRELQQLTVNRIQDWANAERLGEHPHLLPLLQAWHRWGNGEDCSRYIKKLTDTDRGLIAFLLAVLNDAVNQTMTIYQKNPYWDKLIQDIEVFIPMDQLVTHAKLLFEDNYFEKLREKEQLALMIFLDIAKVNTQKIIPKMTV